MPRFAYVDGRFVPHPQARVHVEDRGYQFADGVYEVVAIRDGALLDEKAHLDRLHRSLGELRIAWPRPRRVIELVMHELVRRNAVRDGLVYVQITRGVAPRDFKFPMAAKPTLVMTTRRMIFATPEAVEQGVKVITIPDIRWQRRDIKSVSLLPQVLGKQRAAEAGAMEAWQVDPDGMVTEGTSSNAWIVTQSGELVTRAPSNAILSGITRQTLLRVAGAAGLTYVERPFAVEEAYRAREAFLTSATTFVLPVTEIDGRVIGNGRAGSLALALRVHYLEGAARAKRGNGAMTEQSLG